MAASRCVITQKSAVLLCFAVEGSNRAKINKFSYLNIIYLFILIVTNNSMEQNPAGVVNSLSTA